jgi:plastocyanin
MRRVKAGRHVPLVGILGITLSIAGCSGQAASASSSPSATVAPTDSPPPESAVTATSEPAEAAPAGAVTITVNNDGARFHPDEVTMVADAVVFFLVHEGGEDVGALHHNLNIGPELPPGAALVSSPMLEPGDAFVFTVTGLEPGEYRIWCSVSEHYSFGMVGTLTVTP